METFFDIALIITSIATIACVVLEPGPWIGKFGRKRTGRVRF